MKHQPSANPQVSVRAYEGSVVVEQDEENSAWPEEFENDQIESKGYLEECLRNQSHRIAKMSSASRTVAPTHEGRSLLDVAIESFYGLSCVSAHRTYLRFFDVAVETDMLDHPIFGELVSDSAISTDGHIRRIGSVSLGSRGAFILWDEDNQDHLIASTATTFRKIFAAFTEYRSEVCKIEFNEFESGFVSEQDEELELDQSRKFWTSVAQTDPHILSSGSRFWSGLVNNAILWRD